MKSYKIAPALFITALLGVLFNFPFMEIANKKILIAGIPMLYLYLFLIWMLAIVLLFWVSNLMFKSHNKDE